MRPRQRGGELQQMLLQNVQGHEEDLECIVLEQYTFACSLGGNHLVRSASSWNVRELLL